MIYLIKPIGLIGDKKRPRRGFNAIMILLTMQIRRRVGYYSSPCTCIFLPTFHLLLFYSCMHVSFSIGLYCVLTGVLFHSICRVHVHIALVLLSMVRMKGGDMESGETGCLPPISDSISDHRLGESFYTGLEYMVCDAKINESSRDLFLPIHPHVVD